MAAPTRVLIIEDDPMVAETHRAFIDGVAGFQVVGWARAGGEGLGAVQDLSPDLVLLDVYLPDVDGMEVLRDIRGRGLPSDVIVITASHDGPIIREALRGGAIDYIIKPFRFERLRATLEAYRRDRAGLERAVALDQAQIDRVLKNRPDVDDSRELPKGLSAATLDQIAAYLAGCEAPVNAASTSAALGMSRVTARRYLDHLVNTRQATVEIRYGSVGRPIHWYRTTEQR